MARVENDTPRPERGREDNPETRRDWETLQENVGVDKTERLRIGGGWLVRTTVVGVGVAMVHAPSAIGEAE